MTPPVNKPTTGPTRRRRAPGIPDSSTRRAARDAKARQRLPDGEQCCALCGETDIHTLTTVPDELLKRCHLLEKHHVVGRHHDGKFVVVLCRNCHTKCSIAQLNDGVPLKVSKTFPERLACMLAALASFLRRCAETCAQWAAQLQAFIHNLDTQYPQWRNHLWVD